MNCADTAKQRKKEREREGKKFKFYILRTWKEGKSLKCDGAQIYIFWMR